MPARLTRRSFLLAAGSVAAAMMAVRAAERAQGIIPMTSKSSGRMPTLFIGHGSPMNAIEDNRWSKAFRELAATLPKPRAVIAVSAHWYTSGSFLTADEHPKTIHDFGGFPQSLFEQQYPAPGDPRLAREAASMLGGNEAMLRSDWGLDHGTWTVLKYLLPDADVPVIQLSIDRDATGAAHVEAGRKLASLRDEGVLLLGSGNITHNLRDAATRMRSGNTSRVDWAEQFDADVESAVTKRDLGWLANAHLSEVGPQCHPTPDHYLPLLYVAGAGDPSDPVVSPITGFDAGSLSMRSIRIG